MTADEALAYAQSATGKAWAADGYPEDEVIAVLAAEVRRMRAKFSCVEALPAWWRKHDKDVWHTDRMDGEQCADELERALKGEP